VEWIAITGTRTVRAQDCDRLAQRLAALDVERVTLITGACIGVDALAAAFWHRLGGRVHTIVPANRAQVDPYWAAACTTWEAMPAGTDYRARNREMVDQADQVLAFARYPEADGRSRRSGTWMTVRLARKAQKLVEVHVFCSDQG